MLHAGDAERRGVSHGAHHDPHSLVVGQGRNRLVHQIRSRVLQRSGWISLCVAHDRPAGRILRLRRDPATATPRNLPRPCARRSASRTRDCPASVASMSCFVGMFGGVHLVSSQFPPRIHSPFGVTFARSPISRANSCALLASFSCTLSSCIPPETKCTCASLNPGKTSFPPASITCVRGPRQPSISEAEPTATIRSPRTATASALAATCPPSTPWRW